MDKAYWIGCPGRTISTGNDKDYPAPHFRKEFVWNGTGEGTELVIAAAGYYELYLNGERVGDQVLAPAPSCYDKHAHFNRHKLDGLLRDGVNVVGVILGNGFYNCRPIAAQPQVQPPWRNCPKFLLAIDGVLGTDETWLVNGDGPIRLDSPRNGEFYDARLELDGWAGHGYSAASGWLAAERVPGPGGELGEELQEPCVVYATLPMREISPGVYDSGQNLAGWGRLRVEGGCGATVTLRYAELLGPDGKPDQSQVSPYVTQGEFQTDKYTLRGGGEELWEPRFAYHGFRYVQVEIAGDAKLLSLDARAVGTGFAVVGEIETSDATLNALQSCAYWSFRSNYVGFPTDCPQREKQGWTGDALLAAETGLYNFDAAAAYSGWLEALADTQRPSGQLAAKAPLSGWGYNWGYGPAWDSALILIPAYIYAHTADLAVIKRHYDHMRRYLDFCDSMATGRILSFGLGDWASPVETPPPAITSTAYYYSDVVAMAKFAGLLGLEDDRSRHSELAGDIKAAFNAKFHAGDGVYGSGQMTELAVAVHHGLALDPQLTADRLAVLVKDNRHKANFGILGAKAILRALAEHGHVDTAYQVLVQGEYPGWTHWLKLGATTLYECWDGKSSCNHIMFGDFSAWLYQCLGGFEPSLERPGWKDVSIRPRPVAALPSFRAECRGYLSEWSWKGEKRMFKIVVPDGARADLSLPDGSLHALDAGEHEFSL